MQPGRMVQGSGNGTVKGKKYFTCGDDRGCFVKPGEPHGLGARTACPSVLGLRRSPLAVRALFVSVTNDRSRRAADELVIIVESVNQPATKYPFPRSTRTSRLRLSLVPTAQDARPDAGPTFCVAGL